MLGNLGVTRVAGCQLRMGAGTVFRVTIVNNFMDTAGSQQKAGLIQQALNELEQEPVLLGGKLVKPSQCYRFSATPPHVLYNTNCPDQLMEKIEAILLKFKNAHEGIAQK